MEVVPLLVARLGIAAVSCDSAKQRLQAAAFMASWAVAIVVKNDVSICGLSVNCTFERPGWELMH